MIPLKYSDRSKTPIEPYLSDQWFVKMDRRWPRSAMDAVNDGRVKFLPGALRQDAISTGSARSATGASAGNCGGDIAFRSGTRSCSRSAS